MTQGPRVIVALDDPDVADALALDDPQGEFAPKPFMKRCLALGRQRVLQRRVTSEGPCRADTSSPH